MQVVELQNNPYQNLNIETEQNKLKKFTILMTLEVVIPAFYIVEPGNVYVKALVTLMFILPIMSILSYSYNKDDITYKISKKNDVNFKNALRYRLTHFILPAIIYFTMSPLIFIIANNLIYFIIYEVSGFILFLLYNIIINKKNLNDF